MIITSLQNPRVKHALSLREKRQRKRDGLMLVEGFDELTLALASGVRPVSLFYCPTFFGPVDSQRLIASCLSAGAELIETDARIFEKIAYRENPDGWLAVTPVVGGTLETISASNSPLLIVVEAVEKPGNLGAILRTADAAGARAAILCDPTVDLGNPNVLRPSRGALFSLPIVQATTAEAIAWLKRRLIQIVAATPDANTRYTDVDLRGAVAIAVGTEKEGLSEQWLAQADIRAGVPMFGKVNSLNVSVAASLFLFEAVRQRGNAVDNSP